MHETLPTHVPDSAVAGDTWRWAVELPDHPPSDGWALTYAFRGAQTVQVTAQPDGETYVVTVPAAETAKLGSGVCPWSARVAKDGERYTVATGTVTVEADLGEGPTTNERILAAIEATLEGRASQDADTYQIAGRAVSKTPHDKLMDLRARYRYLVEIERRGGRVPHLARAL